MNLTKCGSSQSFIRHGDQHFIRNFMLIKCNLTLRIYGIDDGCTKRLVIILDKN